MYHTADFKRWLHHVHLPEHHILTRLEKILLDKRLWASILVLAGVVAFVALVFWASKGQYAPDATNPAYPLLPYVP